MLILIYLSYIIRAHEALHDLQKYILLLQNSYRVRIYTRGGIAGTAGAASAVPLFRMANFAVPPLSVRN